MAHSVQLFSAVRGWHLLSRSWVRGLWLVVVLRFWSVHIIRHHRLRGIGSTVVATPFEVDRWPNRRTLMVDETVVESLKRGDQAASVDLQCTCEAH